MDFASTFRFPEKGQAETRSLTGQKSGILQAAGGRTQNKTLTLWMRLERAGFVRGMTSGRRAQTLMPSAIELRQMTSVTREEVVLRHQQTRTEKVRRLFVLKRFDAKNQTVAIFSVRALEMADHALSWPPERDLLQRPSFSLCRSVHLFAAHFVDVACMHSQHLWLYSFDQSMS